MAGTTAQDGNTQSKEQSPLESLMAEAVDSAQDGEVTVGSLLDSFGNRGFGPLVALFGLIAAIPPIGGIPGIPTTMGVLSALIALQMVFGAEHPWVPNFIQDRGIDKDKVEKARDKANGFFKRIDKLVSPRLTWATGPRGQRVVAFIMVFLGLVMIPLELLPFAAALPASGLVLLGLSLTARDGVLMILGCALAAVAASLGIYFYFF